MSQILWYKADAIVGLNDGDKVSQWNDSSGNNNHAVQSAEANKPIYKTNILNGFPVVRFDGNDDYMKFTTALSTIRTAFFVVKAPSAPYAYSPILGHADLYDWHGDGASVKVIDNQYSSLNIRNGSAWVQGVSTLTTNVLIPLTNFKYITFVTADNVNAGRITQDRGNPYRNWRGDYAEIILYDTALTDSDRQAVESYLNNKYFVAPPPSGQPTTKRFGGIPHMNLDVNKGIMRW